MKYTVHIRKNATGEVREYKCILEWEPHHNYWWAEGNMSCDCNRERDFLRAGGEPVPNELCDTECGDSRFSVVKIVLDNGEVVPFEDNLR